MIDNRDWSSISQRGVPTYCSAKISWRTAWKWIQLVPEGARPKFYYVNQLLDSNVVKFGEYLKLVPQTYFQTVNVNIKMQN